MEAKTSPERIVQDVEPTETSEYEQYRVSTYEDVPVIVDIDRSTRYSGPSKPRVIVGNERLDTQVEVVTDIRLLGFELWRYTYRQGEDKTTHAGSGSVDQRFEEVEIEENYVDGEVHEFSIRIKA